MTENVEDQGDRHQAEPGATPSDLFAEMRRHIKLLTLAPLAAGAIAAGVTGLLEPTFTATTTFMLPQQSQSGAASLLASLGPLAGLAGGNAALGSSADRYVALMQSVTLSDRIVDQFKLMDVYETKFRMDARKLLADNVRIVGGKKDGLISVAVDDKSPRRAADIANRYVTELSAINQSIAVTEAQQRRVFFDQQLKLSQQRLIRAQQVLQASGFNASALKAEPKAAADAFARLKAEMTTAEVRLQTLRGSLADGAPEVARQLAELAALRAQLARAEQGNKAADDSDYVGKYRDYKYQETLFELYARQFEIARVDESREGALIQVIDPATPPEKKSKPRRFVTSLASTLVAFFALSAFIVFRRLVRPQPAVWADKRSAPVG